MHLDPAEIANSVLIDETNAFKRAKSPDTPENFRSVWASAKLPLIEAAMPFRQVIPLPVTERPRVAFFVCDGMMVAHVKNLQTLLSGLAAIDAPIEPCVIVYGHANPDFKRAFPKTVYCPPVAPLDRWRLIRDFAVKQKLSAIIFVSAPIGMAFASTFGVAPRHIWWSHKWHGLELPYLDGYIDGTMGDVGPPWIKTYSAFPDFFDAGAIPKATAERAKFKFRTVFGTLCRAEKITDEYCAVIQGVLDANPDSCFVYTGRSRVAGLDAIPRTHFIGWVDTSVWTNVIDVFLDTFPFCSGHTAWQAVAAGKPVVSVEPEKPREQGFINDLMKAAGRPYIGATDARHYIELATGFADGRLAEWTRHYGQFYRDVLRDEKRMARSVSEAILSVIAAPPASGKA